jgi:hypothetical protein
MTTLPLATVETDALTAPQRASSLLWAPKRRWHNAGGFYLPGSGCYSQVSEGIGYWRLDVC